MKWLSLIVDWFTALGEALMEEGLHGSRSGTWNMDSPPPIAKRDNDSPQPVAWLAVAADGSESSAVYMLREQADAAARQWGWQIAPLYPFPALWPDDEPQIGVRCANAMADAIQRLRLTDEERRVIESAIEDILYGEWRDDPDAAADAATLRNLLERTK